MTIQDTFVSKGTSYICVTVYYHLKHQPMVAMATEQFVAFNGAQNQKKHLFCPVHLSIHNMIEWSMEGFLEFSFALFIP